MTLAETESLVKIVGGSIAGIAAVGAIATAIWQWRRATEQRRDELRLHQREFRHRQARFAREVLTEIFSDPVAKDALKMLDWHRADYRDVENELTFDISRHEVAPALAVNAQAATGGCPVVDESAARKEEFIRTRFEALYYYLEQVEQLIVLEIINFNDVETTFRYYMRNALADESSHKDFLTHYDSPRALDFLQRFRVRT